MRGGQRRRKKQAHPSCPRVLGQQPHDGPLGPSKGPFWSPRNERKAQLDLEKDLECLRPKGLGGSVEGDGQRGWGRSEMGMLPDPHETKPRKEAREEGKEFTAGKSFECWWEVPQPGGAGGQRELEKLTPRQASWLWFLEFQCSGNVPAPHPV